MRRISILGSTGSIGVNALAVVRTLGGRVGVVGLSTHRRTEDLKKQIEEFKPLAVAVGDQAMVDDVKQAKGAAHMKVYCGGSGLVEIATLPEADLVVNALVGAAGILPTLAAVDAGKDVAIANKECLVAAGEIIAANARRRGVHVLPVDSEHSAIYQCIRGEDKKAIRRIILTASGGPLIDMKPDEMAKVDAAEALRHPTWRMGRKVTIDSATLLNKGFEVIEAHWLFGIEAERIEVLVERKSLVHSLVEFVDGSVMAVLSVPDMKLPIQYALTFPERVDTSFARLDLAEVGELAFEKPDLDRFPCLRLAYEAASRGGTATAVLSAADEVAVEAFLEGRITFRDIYPVLRKILSLHEPRAADDLANILEADRWARLETEDAIKEIGRG